MKHALPRPKRSVRIGVQGVADNEVPIGNITEAKDLVLLHTVFNGELSSLDGMQKVGVGILTLGEETDQQDLTVVVGLVKDFRQKFVGFQVAQQNGRRHGFVHPQSLAKARLAAEEVGVGVGWQLGDPVPVFV